jgi:hypothetical protein
MPRRRNVQSKPFDLPAYQERAVRETPPRRDGVESVFTPIGVPVGIEIHRKTGETPEHKPPNRISVDQMGSTVVLDYYIFGVKVYAKYEREARSLTLFIEDSEGMEKYATWTL